MEFGDDYQSGPERLRAKDYVVLNSAEQKLSSGVKTAKSRFANSTRKVSIFAPHRDAGISLPNHGYGEEVIKRRFWLPLIYAMMSFPAVAMTFDNVSLPNNSGVAKAGPVVTDGSQSRRIDAPVEAPEGMSGANETPQLTPQYDDGPAQTFDMCGGGLWRHLDDVTKITIVTLLIMSIWAIVITIERYLTFSAASDQSREFALKLRSSLKIRTIDEAISLSDRYKKSHLAILAKAGLQNFRDHQLPDGISREVIEASTEALKRAMAGRIVEFRRGLSGLSTIRSTAPFVGMFGTVFGLIHAFEGLSEATDYYGVGGIAGAVAVALFTTAFGLVVAVPVAWFLRYFTGEVDKFEVEMDVSSTELIDFFLKQRGKK